MTVKQYRLWEWSPRNSMWLEKGRGSAADMEALQTSLRDGAVKFKINNFGTVVLPVRDQPRSDPAGMGVELLVFPAEEQFAVWLWTDSTSTWTQAESGSRDVLRRYMDARETEVWDARDTTVAYYLSPVEHGTPDCAPDVLATVSGQRLVRYVPEPEPEVAETPEPVAAPEADLLSVDELMLIAMQASDALERLSEGLARAQAEGGLLAQPNDAHDAAAETARSLTSVRHVCRIVALSTARVAT